MRGHGKTPLALAPTEVPLYNTLDHAQLTVRVYAQAPHQNEVLHVQVINENQNIPIEGGRIRLNERFVLLYVTRGSVVEVSALLPVEVFLNSKGRFPIGQQSTWVLTQDSLDRVERLLESVRVKRG